MPIACVSALRYLWLVIIFALISIGYHTTPAQAAAYVARGSGGPQCNVIYWLYANGYSQVELLNYSWKEMHYLRWTPDNSTTFKMRWRNGKTQSFTLRQPGKNLRQVSFFCQSEGFINLQVTDCRTKQPLYNALISDSTGKQFRGFPTKKDGWGVVPCNCNGRLPQKVSIKVSRSGYQTATGKVLFSDKAINRYRICLNKSAPAASTPASPWTAWRGHKYRVITTKMTWNQAQAYAQRLGGHLVTISDKAENDFVADLARGRGISRQSWLGFTDQGSEGRWRWVNNQKVTYTNWYTGEPNNAHGNEDCAMVGWHSKHSWNDGDCNEKMGFVVEAE